MLCRLSGDKAAALTGFGVGYERTENTHKNEKKIIPIKKPIQI